MEALQIERLRHWFAQREQSTPGQEQPFRAR